VEYGLLYEGEEDVRVEGTFVGLIQNYDLVFEQEGVVYALPDEDAVGYVAQAGLFAGFVVETNAVAYLLAEGC
jgi:hypothetical protein